MRLLRAAKLAVGIPGEAYQTAASAKWIVFFDDEIRDQALTRWREARHKRQHTKRRQVGVTDIDHGQSRYRGSSTCRHRFRHCKRPANSGQGQYEIWSGCVPGLRVSASGWSTAEFRPPDATDRRVLVTKGQRRR